ncbi:MAG: alpha/beta fold hydrolase [Vicinamibacterales bacterium]
MPDLIVRERTVQIEGRRMGYREAGAGWPVVLLHAFPLSSRIWDPQLERTPEGWRFIAADLRGFGASAMGESTPITVDDYARDIGALMDALELDSAVICGLSLGGYVALAMYRQVAARFAGLVLADTRPQADTPQAREGRMKMRECLSVEGPAGVADQMLPALLSEDTRARKPELAAMVHGMIAGASAAAIDAAIGAIATRPDSTPGLDAISCATLVLVGALDAITPPADAGAMQRAISRASLVIVPEAGHLSNVERPDVFSQALSDFLLARL